MKILLAAVNAKYTHMNPALYSIKAYAGDAGSCMEIAEYTINQYPKDVLKDIFQRQPEVIGFSCYIWNMKFISDILADIKKVLPDTLIFLGGPEVSYNVDEVMSKYSAADGVFFGEGEKAWKELLDIIGKEKDTSDNRADLLKLLKEKQIPGLRIRGSQNADIWPDIMKLDEIPFIYSDLSLFKNRMLYYETSRGCPFSCSYCLSSVDKKVRVRSLDLVYPELQFFLDNNVRIVKFIDRTFNADKKHAMGIWKYLSEHDNGVSRFHFEIEADILGEAEFEFLSTVRPGLFQFEVGVQSTNPKTLEAINRKADTEKIKSAVRRIRSFGNIPVHTDLIAGLPYEDMDSFKNSFNEIYELGSDELQLGFLKVLHGTEMERKASKYGIVWESLPPYEVISTNWISYSDVLYLKEVEDQLERYYNSGAFKRTIAAFEKYFSGAFEMYEYIASYYREHCELFHKQSRISAYEMLRGIIDEKLTQMNAVFAGWDICMAQAKHFDALLLMDLYEKEKLKSRPAFFEGESERRVLEREYIKEHGITGNVHIEFFDFDVEQFLENGDIIQTEKNECSVMFEYEGQGSCSAICINGKKILT